MAGWTPPGVQKRTSQIAHRKSNMVDYDYEDEDEYEHQPPAPICYDHAPDFLSNGA